MGAILADDILDEFDSELDDDFDEDSMEDILGDDQDDDQGYQDDDSDDDWGDDSDNDLDDDPEDSSDDFDTPSKEKKGSIKDKIIQKVKPLFNQITSSKTILIITVSAFILIIFLSIGSWWLFFKSNSDVEPQMVKGTINSEQDIKNTLAQKNEVIFEDIIDFEPFERIPLKTSSTMGSCSINISIELIDHRLRKQVYGMEDRIRDIVVGQVAEMTWLELRNPEGKIMLKYNLLKRINSIFPKPTIRNIYFTYFIMQ